MTSWSRRTRRTSDKNRTRQLVLIVLTLAVGLALAAPAGATTAAEDDTGNNNNTGNNASPPTPNLITPEIALLEVVDQTTFVAADGTFGLDLALEPVDLLLAAPESYEISVTVYGRLEDESEVDEPLTQPLNRLPPFPVDGLLSSSNGRFHLDVPIRSGDPFDNLDRVLLPLPGVYPVSIELRTATGPIAAARTHLVRLPKVSNEEDALTADGTRADASTDDTTVSSSLPVAIVLNVSAAEGLTLDDVEQLLIRHPTTPLTVVLEPGVVNLLRADPVRAGRFAVAVGGRPTLAVPTVDLDPSALVEIDESDLYAEANRATRSDLRSLSLTPADDVAILGAPLTQAGADVLSDLGVRTVLDTEGQSGGVFQLGSGPDPLRVVRFDQDLGEILGGGSDGPHRANRVLARMTLRGLTDDSPVVIGGSTLGVDPLRSINAFLRSLRQPGAPRPILLTETPLGPTIRLAERPEQDLGQIIGVLAQVESRLETYETFHSDGGNTPAHYRQQILAGLTRQRNPLDRSRALASIRTQLDEDLGVVTLQEGQPVTLAARSAPIPIGLESSAIGSRNVMLRFASEKVVATEAEQVVSIEPGASSINVEFETRALGVSPLEVSVWTPDGERLLANTRFEIRSTAIPGFGLLMSIVAVGLLGAWWVLDARKRREALEL